MPGKLMLTTPTDCEIHLTRTFEAPRALVWDCHTEPSLVRKWLLGPPGWTMPVCEIDLRVGGKYRYEWARAGKTMGMGGVFREVIAPERLVSSELFDEDWTGGETLVTQIFAEDRGRTTVSMTVVYATKEARDGALSTGMLEGMESGYVRLDELFANPHGAPSATISG